MLMISTPPHHADQTILHGESLLKRSIVTELLYTNMYIYQDKIHADE
ncbi:hypothetical protein ACOJUR_06555 [Alicyclobacillus tolerans]